MTSEPATGPSVVGAKVTVKVSVWPLASERGRLTVEVLKPAPVTPNTEMVWVAAQVLRMVNVIGAERQPVCTVPKSTSNGVMAMQLAIGSCTQMPEEQTWPGAQATHALPPKPQLVAEVPVD